MTKTVRQRLGDRGESLAAEELTDRGYEVVERNWRCQVGEVDVIVRRRDEWGFFEVRTRRGKAYGTPEDSLTSHKLQRMLDVARAYLAEHELSDVDCRIGFVAVEMDHRGHLLRLDVYENID